MRIKRYVTEYARDVLRPLDPRVKSGEYRHPYADEILAVLRHCERGRVSSQEAVRCIVAIDQRAAGMTWKVEQAGGDKA